MLKLSEGWLSVVRLPTDKHKRSCLDFSAQTPQLSTDSSKLQQCKYNPMDPWKERLRKRARLEAEDRWVLHMSTGDLCCSYS